MVDWRRMVTKLRDTWGRRSNLSVFVFIGLQALLRSFFLLSFSICDGRSVLFCYKVGSYIRPIWGRVV